MSHEMLSSILYIMWPIQLQRLNVLQLMVQEEMHLHENNLFAIFPWPRNVVAQYPPLHHVTYAATKFKAAAADGLGEDTNTWNRMHEHTRSRKGRRTDRLRWTNFGTKLMYLYFYKKERV